LFAYWCKMNCLQCKCCIFWFIRNSGLSYFVCLPLLFHINELSHHALASSCVPSAEYAHHTASGGAIKPSSAFKGELYFQVGQMEGPKVPRRGRREASVLRVWGIGRGTVAPPHYWIWDYPQKKNQKSTFESHIFCIFASEIVSPAGWVLARLSIVHYNCYL